MDLSPFNESNPHPCQKFLADKVLKHRSSYRWPTKPNIATIAAITLSILPDLDDIVISFLNKGRSHTVFKIYSSGNQKVNYVFRVFPVSEVIAYHSSRKHELGYDWAITTFVDGHPPNGLDEIPKAGFYEELQGLMEKPTKLPKFKLIGSIYFSSNLIASRYHLNSGKKYNEFFAVGPIVDVWLNPALFFLGAPSKTVGLSPRCPTTSLMKLVGEILKRLFRIGENIVKGYKCDHFTLVHTDLLYCNIILDNLSKKINGIIDWEGAVILPGCFSPAVISVGTSDFPQTIGACRVVRPSPSTGDNDTINKSGGEEGSLEMMR
ncbi:hypothetical protein ONS95_003528 [Cadophora gregata]|uniref:uncharacterized protein n=1 Tax=Cadophora gregata TaxID=51156 RepID=UPI0026DDAEF3|nr:uncharacterized protein ONS95_003528 [Cadophora gregata]KAK0099399.1 hypothetical protein ONS96_008427 [Cadophora gregata f. sp. sojae]KAK0106806.1 hypothetical protein ONS95_003528 [Cadophora gregata]